MAGSWVTAESSFPDVGGPAMFFVLGLHEKSLYHYSIFSSFCLEHFSGFLTSYQWKSLDQEKYNHSVLGLAYRALPTEMSNNPSSLMSYHRSLPQSYVPAHWTTCNMDQTGNKLSVSLECFSFILPLVKSWTHSLRPTTTAIFSGNPFLISQQNWFPRMETQKVSIAPWTTYLLVRYNILLNYLFVCLSCPLNFSLPYFTRSSFHKACPRVGTP